jgi:ubiquitin carboxyl-terminal hydrolase 7
LIRTEKEGKWLRFDDDRVTPVTNKEVFEENFGDDTQTSPGGGNNFSLLNNGVMRSNNSRLMKRFTNAYMLVYIQKSKLNSVLAPVVESDIPDHLSKSLNSENLSI